MGQSVFKAANISVNILKMKIKSIMVKIDPIKKIKLVKQEKFTWVSKKNDTDAVQTWNLGFESSIAQTLSSKLRRRKRLIEALGLASKIFAVCSPH